jgi:hypothetical protein
MSMLLADRYKNETKIDEDYTQETKDVSGLNRI